MKIPILKEENYRGYSILNEVEMPDLTKDFIVEDRLDQQAIDDLTMEYYSNKKYVPIKEWAEIFGQNNVAEVTRESQLEMLKGLETQKLTAKMFWDDFIRTDDRNYMVLSWLEMDRIEEVERKIKQFDYNLAILERGAGDNKLDIENLKGKTDLRQIAERLSIKFTKKSGKNWQGKCCFHKDNNPSMSVSNKYFYCFACGASGDVIEFVMKLQKIDFKEAIKLL